MSDTMIISGSSKDAMIKGELELTNGLDFINSVFIDTHFTERGRFGRLIQTVTCNPGVMGLGLGEDTAVVIYKGNEMEVVGSGEFTSREIKKLAPYSPIGSRNLVTRMPQQLLSIIPAERIISHLMQ